MAERSHRLFFALWPDDGNRNDILSRFKYSQYYNKPGHVLALNQLHITLHFIGKVSQDEMKCMLTAATNVDAQGFSLRLNHFDYFTKAKVLCMGLQQNVAGLVDLHEKLACALQDCNYRAEKRIYTPHLTLMRKLPKPEVLTGFEPVELFIKEFVLVESISSECGVTYKVREKYPLN